MQDTYKLETWPSSKMTRLPLQLTLIWKRYKRETGQVNTNSFKIMLLFIDISFFHNFIRKSELFHSYRYKEITGITWRFFFLFLQRNIQNWTMAESTQWGYFNPIPLWRAKTPLTKWKMRNHSQIIPIINLIWTLSIYLFRDHKLVSFRDHKLVSEQYGNT